LLSLIAHVILIELSASFAMQIAVSVAVIAVMVLAATLLTRESWFDRRGQRLF
jgi:hypothetical protein